MDLLSIIIPVFNVESYLPRCIDSVLQQTYQNLEILLIDDGSTDSSSQICDEYSNKDIRITVVHKKNGGVSSARNKGLDLAKGEYICFIDSDDFIDPMMCEVLMRNAKLYDCEISVCLIDVVKLDNKKTCILKDSHLEKANQVIAGFFSDPFIKEHMYGPFNKLYKREILRDLRFKSYKMGEDILFVFESLLHSKRVYFDSFVGYHYVHRVNSAMTSKFSLKRLDYVYSAKNVVELCCQYAPYASKESYIWLFQHILITMRQIFINRLSARKEYIDFVENSLLFLKNNNRLFFLLPLKRKIDYVLVLHFPFLYQCFSFLRIIKC